MKAARFDSVQDVASAATAVRRRRAAGQCDLRIGQVACDTKDMIRKDGLQ